MSDPTTTIEEFGGAVVTAVRSHFGPALSQSGLYDPTDELTDAAESTLQTPAILIGIESLGEAEEELDGGLGLDPSARMPFIANCYAHCWMSASTENMPARLPEFAGAMMALVRATRPADTGRRGNRWGLGDAVGWPENVSAAPGGLDELHGRFAWIVTWDQAIYTDGGMPT